MNIMKVYMFYLELRSVSGRRMIRIDPTVLPDDIRDGCSLDMVFRLLSAVVKKGGIID